MERCQVLDVTLHHVALADVLQEIASSIASRTPRHLVTVNLDFLRLARSNAAFRQALNTADLAVADGMPVVWAAKLLGTPLPERITGVDIVEQGVALAAARGYRVFLLGGEPGVAEAAAAALVRRHPALDVAGTYAPPFRPLLPEEEAAMLAAIRAAEPDMLFVAFGAPRQELWIREHQQRLGIPVCVGVGGTFNFLAGRVPRAPRWMQRAGLEWLYRLGCEPRRLWRRYLIDDLPVFLRILWAPLAAARFPPAASR